MTVSNRDREKLHMAMTADGDLHDNAMSSSLGLFVRTDADEKLDGHMSGTVDWSGTTDAHRDDLHASMTVSNKQQERFHVTMTADGDSRFRERDGSLGLLVRVNAEDELDGLVSGSVDWSDALHASMTVSNDGSEKLYVAMTADADSQDEAVDGSLGLSVRVNADEKLDSHLSGALDWSDALHASMTVSNDGNEKLYVAMTADADSQDEAVDGSLGPVSYTHLTLPTKSTV